MKKLFLSLSILLSTLNIFGVSNENFNQLHITNGILYNELDSAIMLRGTNLGNWLVQEDWMTGNTCKDQTSMINKLINRFGEETAEELIDIWEENFITTTDLDNIKEIGMNVVRVPFTWMNLVKLSDRSWKVDAFERLDWVIEECGKRNIWVILDMHGCPGSQNGSDHSGVDGGNNKEAMSKFWFGTTEEVTANQTLYYTLWDSIATRYKNNDVVMGFDLMNEPFCTYRYNSSKTESQLHQMLWTVYDNAYKRIRAIDPDRILIMEATWDPIDLPNPSTYGWTNVMYEYHNYLYDDYDNAEGRQITNMQTKVNAINAKVSTYKVPSLMGEFCYMNNAKAWEIGLELLNDNNIHWTNWSYKVQYYYGNWGIFNFSTNNIDISTASESQIRTAFAIRSGSKNSTIYNTIKAATSYIKEPIVPTEIPGKIDCLKSTNKSGTVSKNKSSNGNYLGGFTNGSYAEYKIISEKDTTYTFSILLAAGDTQWNAQSFTVKLNGKKVAESNITGSTGWENFIPHEVSFKVPQGTHTLRITMVGGACNLSDITATFSVSTALTEFFEQEKVYSIEGTIFCDNAFKIYNIQGCNVTNLNGYLKRGVYIVKTNLKAYKILIN